ncbi:MAG TPA: hypothetical protein PK490_18365 [Prosthecobacter sp.]|nr:hypothetical protein [Prosthecobacter sp.]HRK16252.1 hypothetical protein [Prosthecobacter sp.]
MAAPSSLATPELWNSLNWQTVDLVPHTASTKPIVALRCPQDAGLYRITLIDSKWWALASSDVPIKASKKIADGRLESAFWNVPVVLTIGRTTSLKGRLEQHFGTNDKNNRVMKRLSAAFPQLTENQIRESAVSGLLVEVCRIEDWTSRFLLERYGCSLLKPFLDFEAEH